MPQFAIPSLSVDLCLEAAHDLGGDQPLTQTLLALAAEEATPTLDTVEVATTTLRDLGGDVAAAPVAATLAMLALGVEPPEPALEAVTATPVATRPVQNATAKWLARQGNTVFNDLVEHLGHRLATSQRMDLVEDHVQEFIARLIERDTLAPHLAEGKTPKLTVLRHWALQAAFTEIRGWGVDASLRASRGAKTNRDLQADLGRLPPSVVNSEEAVVERCYEVDGAGEVTDYYDPHARSVEDDMISEEIMSAAHFIVRHRIAGGADRYATLFQDLLDGEKRDDLAAKMGVSPNRMASMISQIRTVLRQEVLRA